MNFYLWSVAVLLPIDWFSPTGLLFREFGAKPVCLFLTTGGLAGLLAGRALPAAIRKRERRALAVVGGLLLLGSIAFLLNLLFGWSTWNHARNPFVQFFSQTLLLGSSAVAVIGNARLSWHFDFAGRLHRILPWAAGIHLLFFALQATGLIDHYSAFFLLFRSDGGTIERATGLMSEPSYYGTYAALYGAILLSMPARGLRRAGRLALALALYATAVSINAKTLVIVAGAQAMFAVLRPGAEPASRMKLAAMLLIVGGLGYSFVERFSALDASENLSSAMRFGSTVLATNASMEGYAVPGIGIGQFHFFYREEFAPPYLFLSSEGLDQLSPDAPNRASTFNLYARILLEMGVAGLLLFLAAMRGLLRVKIPPQHQYVSPLLAGSLGFLLTQDTYYYPPLTLACALILGISYSQAATSREPRRMRAAGLDP